MKKMHPKIKKIKTPKGKTQMTDLRTLFPLIWKIVFLFIRRFERFFALSSIFELVPQLKAQL